MGTNQDRVPPEKDRKDAGSMPGAPCNNNAALRGSRDLENRINDARAALHDAIRRVGDRPLSRCPEVLRLSRVLDDLIDTIHIRDKKK